MISKKYKYLSLCMAVLMLAASVGITAKVHYCLMENQTLIVAQKNGCCDGHEIKSCCEAPNLKSGNEEQLSEADCCRDEIKSFAFASEFVNKIVSLQISQLVIVLSYNILHHFSDVTLNHFKESPTIFPPPKLYGTVLLSFKQVLNL